MRSLTDTLKNAQQAESIDALVRIVLTRTGQPTRTYTRAHILNINHPEEPFSQKATVVLENSDGELTDIDLKGFKGVLSYGAIGAAGEEYSATAPLWVIPQTFDWTPDADHCVLSLIGIPNLMAEDKASEKYLPDEDDTKSVKTLINQILGATLACYSHCCAYEVVWEAGYDSLADTYKPKDSFRIYVGGSRLASFRRALDYTGNVARVRADGKWHISKPVVSGTTYDYEYNFLSGHTFFSKAYRQRVVIPGYIVVKSQPDDDPQYSGFAKDPGYDALPAELKKQDFKQMRLESDDQATAIAEAMLSKHQLWSEMGAANVPNNVGAEVFDYVKVTDDKSNYRVGNLGRLTRHYNADKAEWPMSFSFGGWLTVRKVLEGLGITSDELEAYFSRLMVKDLYVENILAENMNFVWIDPDNTIDLSKIGDNLDNLPDGEVYARVKTLHLDAGEIKLDEHILYKAGYNPTDKMPGDTNLDGIPDGAVYQRARSAALTAAGLVILDQVVVGTYGLVKSTDITAGHIKLSSVEQSTGYRTVTDGQKVTWDGKPDNMDEIGEGVTYQRVKSAALSVAGLVILDQVVVGTYGLVKSTDITAGHIILSECEGDLGDIHGDIDDIANGSIYGKVRKTDISAGHIKLYVDQDLDDQGIDIISDGAEKVKINYDGMTLRGKHLYFKGTSGGLRATIGVLSDVLYIETVESNDYIWLDAPGSSAYIVLEAANISLKGGIAEDLKPNLHEQHACGFSNKAWSQMVAEFVYSDDGNIYSYQGHDDIALLKGLKTKKNKKGQDTLDAHSLPQELVIRNDQGQNYVNLGGLSGLSIGIMKALLKRIEVLEAKVEI